MNKIGIILIVLSGIFFGLVFVVPFMPFSLALKGIVVTALVISMEISWWVGVAILGKQVITKYRKQLNPRNWFSSKGKSNQDSGKQ